MSSALTERGSVPAATWKPGLQETSTSRAFNPGLDGIRGLSLSMIMIFHMTLIQPTGGVATVVYHIANSGWISVDLFFVLSSFLITGILLDSKGKPGYFTNFWTRRALRILPLYYAVVAISLLILPHLPHPKLNSFARISGDEWYYWVFLSNISIAKAGAFRHGILDVSWTLAIEEQFYLTFPIIVWLLSRRALAMLLAAIFVASAVCRLLLWADGFSPIALYVLTPTRLEPIAAGAAAALIIRSNLMLRRYIKLELVIAGMACIGLLVIFLLRFGLVWDDPIMQLGGYPLLAVLYAVIVLRIALGAGAGGFFELPILQAFGRYSYAMYLFHLPIRGAIRDGIFAAGIWPTGTAIELLAQTIFYVVSIAATFAAGWCSYHFYEVHFLKLKRYFR
jgi:peptidoglycan/LPS O-acetylase OafA/YrhL